MRRFYLSLPRWLRWIVKGFLIATLTCAMMVGCAWWYLHPTVERTDGIIYGTRHGKPLTMDIIRPSNANGYGVALMVSGSWKSGSPGETPIWLMAPLLRRGFSVFAVCHISQPEATVMEIIEDVHRGLRFIRHHADEYRIDPQHLGVTGGSAGGHLSLMLATCGGPGAIDAEDPIDRESSAVQAVAIFFPVTDLLNLGDSTENPGDGGPPINYVAAFGPDSTNMEKWKVIGRECSPIYHVHDDLPPTLIYHGNADTLVPLDQSQRFVAEAEKKGTTVNLHVHPGGGHGWATALLDVRQFAIWFERHLPGQ